ncbi:MAG: Rrf2 family transcriptional regulator [Desulfobulbaceae bacterium]|nr:Rrf2 family transcriptional regulator [Candidatus Kapabacteria bacterium]MBS4000241.1 Rrf2 family transcriptional regulator [Desulfobulbaceae bacterium]
MTVIFSKKCELGLQAVLYLSAFPKNTLFSALEISEKINAPKEFVSKILQTLTSSGIVGSKKGNSGGFYLKIDPGSVRLIDVVSAIDGLDLFRNCVLGFPGCSVDEPCPVHESWGKLRNETYTMLSNQTLAELRDITVNKINSLKK